MKALKIVRPYPNVSITDAGATITNKDQLKTFDPREVATLGAGTNVIWLDLGAPQPIDTLFLGYNALGMGAIVSSVVVSNSSTFASGNVTAYTGSAGDNSLSVKPGAANPRNYHGVIQFASPVVGRYVAVTIAAAGTLGILAAGSSFTPRWGSEFGAGRPITDTSTVERLFSGGYGIDLGAIVGGYSWTLGDLQPAETVALYDIIRSVGQSRPILVIEDPDFDYGTLTAQANVTISGNGKIVTKSGGGTADNASAVGPIRTGSLGISFQGVAISGGVTVGFSTAPTAANDTSGLAYGVTISTSGGSAGFDLSGGALVAGATLARSTVGWRFNVSGVLVSEAINVARFDYDPVTLALKGLLYENASTNVLLQSQALDNAAFTASNLTVVANSTTAPDGAATAEKLTPTATSGTHTLAQLGLTVTGGTGTHSIFVKANGYTKVALKEGSATGFYASFDLSAVSVLANTGTSATITSVGGGWYRITLTVTGNTTQGFRLHILDPAYTVGDPNSSIFAGNTTSGVYAWQGQLETSLTATSIIPTTTVSVTRAADVLTWNWASIGVANGTFPATYTFDTGTQAVSTTIAGGTSTAPYTLNRPWIKGVTVASLGLVRVVPAGTTTVASFATGDRIALTYDDARFTMYRNGVIVDVYPASPGLALGFDSSFNAVGDQIAEVNTFSLDYDNRVHWGLFQKLDTFERLNPLDTKWSLTVLDWG